MCLVVDSCEMGRLWILHLQVKKTESCSDDPLAMPNAQSSFYHAQCPVQFIVRNHEMHFYTSNLGQSRMIVMLVKQRYVEIFNEGFQIFLQ